MSASRPDQNVIWKILTPSQWTELNETGLFRGSPADVADGFIHFSTEQQLAGTLDKHYPDQPDVQLVRIDARTLGEALKWEKSRSDELFPHLYGTLAIESVIDCQTRVEFER